jgi:hypothetical protein
LGLFDQTCRQISLGKLVNARMSGRAVSRCSRRGQLAGQGLDDPVELGADRVRVGLVVDRVQQPLTQGHDDFAVVAIRFAA